MSLPRRSQSALEYMMTYGWAILIIVIVAVILYSMGIFNPSSSVTFTSSGFSPFTVSSSLCNNLGYKIAIIAGPIPNNANSLTINKVFVTSATGTNATTTSYKLANPVTLKSGQSATILIPNVICTSANTHYSISANIEYSYTAGTLGLQYVNTSGTVTGTSISGKPSVLTSYEPITITNTQSSATPSPFQQMINFTSSDPGFSSIATGNFGQNVEFFYYNGTVIPSWLENYTSNYAIWWLKIAAIPAGSSETVYVGFAPTSTNLFNTVNDGEAPQLSSTYAEYDDGANVFNFYDNFKGTSLNTSKWTSGTSSGGTITVNNGITLTYSSSSVGGAWIVGNQYFSQSSNVVFEALFNMYGTSNFNDIRGRMYWWEQGQTSIADNNAYSIYHILSSQDYGYFTDSAIGANIANIMLPYGTLLGTLPTPSSSSDYNVMTQQILTSGSFIFNTVNYPSYSLIASKTVTGSTTDSFSPLIQASDDGSSGNTVTFNVQWVRVRAYPPNGVMPSVTFGSIS